MPVETSIIVHALAPGVALTSMIFYYGNLQSRLIFTTDTIRKLNAEARELKAEHTSDSQARQESVRWQVDFLKQRFASIRRAILFVYGGFMCAIFTILTLLLFQGHPQLGIVPVALFALAFVFAAIATLLSSHEISLAQRTILEDIASSHDLDRFDAKRSAALAAWREADRRTADEPRISAGVATEALGRSAARRSARGAPLPSAGQPSAPFPG